MLLLVTLLVFISGLLSQSVTEVDGFGPEGPLQEGSGDLSPSDGILPVEIHVSFKGQSTGYEGYYPAGSYGYGYQYPSFYPGLFARYQRFKLEHAHLHIYLLIFISFLDQLKWTIQDTL